MTTDMKELTEIVNEWTKESNARVSVWDKGNYGRVYVKSRNGKYSGWIDTDGNYSFFWAYFRSTLHLSQAALEQIAEEKAFKIQEA